MPTKRKRVTRGRNGVTTMDNLPLECLLEFAAGWSPPKNEFQQSRSYWQTWAEFMADWLAVRDEYMTHDSWHEKNLVNGNFAERVYQKYGVKGPPITFGYNDVMNALDAAIDEPAAELIADIDLGNGR